MTNQPKLIKLERKLTANEEGIKRGISALFDRLDARPGSLCAGEQTDWNTRSADGYSYGGGRIKQTVHPPNGQPIEYDIDSIWCENSPNRKELDILANLAQRIIRLNEARGVKKSEPYEPLLFVSREQEITCGPEDRTLSECSYGKNSVVYPTRRLGEVLGLCEDQGLPAELDEAFPINGCDWEDVRRILQELDGRQILDIYEPFSEDRVVADYIIQTIRKGKVVDEDRERYVIRVDHGRIDLKTVAHPIALKGPPKREFAPNQRVTLELSYTGDIIHSSEVIKEVE